MKTLIALLGILATSMAHGQATSTATSTMHDFLAKMCSETNDADFSHVAEDDDICDLYGDENWKAIRAQFAKTIKANRERGNQNRFYFPYSDVVVNLNGAWRDGTDWRIIRHKHLDGTCIVGNRQKNSDKFAFPPGGVPLARWWVAPTTTEGKAWLVEICGQLRQGLSTDDYNAVFHEGECLREQWHSPRCTPIMLWSGPRGGRHFRFFAWQFHRYGHKIRYCLQTPLDYGYIPGNYSRIVPSWSAAHARDVVNWFLTELGAGRIDADSLWSEDCAEAY